MRAYISLRLGRGGGALSTPGPLDMSLQTIEHVFPLRIMPTIFGHVIISTCALVSVTIFFSFCGKRAVNMMQFETKFSASLEDTGACMWLVLVSIKYTQNHTFLSVELHVHAMCMIHN